MMLETRVVARQPPRVRPGLPLLLALILLAVVLAAGGALYAVQEGNAPPPSLPAAPPGAHLIGASQTTQQLGSNGIISTAFYRAAASPAAVIAYYRRTLPGRGGTLGRFGSVITSADAAALPTALQQLPGAFASGSGDHVRARYTYTEYEYGADQRDVGIAVDLRHPHGPTLVFVDMLSR